jgi:uncharacterized ParB-like nuclease family protein
MPIALMVAHAGISDSKNNVAKEVATIHEVHPIDVLAFSPDGSLLVAAKYSFAHFAQVWDWRQSRRVGSEFKHGN